MPREFYTEKDIEDLVKGGILSLQVHDHVVLTELAYEKARTLGVKLVRNGPDQPPSAPVRPYITHKQAYSSSSTVAAPIVAPLPLHKTGAAAKSAPAEMDLSRRIREAVMARIGANADAKLLDVIIKRVLASTGVK